MTAQSARLLGLLFLACAVHGADFRLPLMSAAPRVDGQVDGAEWAGAMRFDGLVWNGTLERRRAAAWVGATSDTLFLALRSQLPAEGVLLATVDRDSLKVVYDDALEVWVDPSPGSDHGRAYQMLANPLGRRGFNFLPRGNVAARADWQADWPFAQRSADGWWSAEVAIPIASIEPGRKATDGAWGINLCRDWKPDWAWSCLAGGAYAPSTRFVFDPAAPLVGQEQSGDAQLGEIDQTLTLSNPGAMPIDVMADLLITRDVMPELHEQRRLTLAPGARERLAVKTTDGSTNRFELKAKVTSADGARVYFEREYGWRRGPAWRWTTVTKSAPPVDFQFAYYPYANHLRAEVDLTNLPTDAKPEQAVLTVRATGGAMVKQIAFDKLVGGKQAQSVDLPPLSGRYELALSLRGAKVPAGEVVKPLERTVYEWEHTPLGRSRKVYPPFEPLTYAERTRTLHTVLRDHRLGGSGLLDQVTATGAPLLAEAMRFDLTYDGKKLGAMTGQSTFAPGGRAEDRMVIDGAFRPTQGGVPAFRYRTTWDVDGMMRYDLTLPATAGKSIDALDLVIPLDDKAAPLMHAMGDAIRNTLYQKVPAGEGSVWDSRKTRAEDLPVGFCTYLYLGGPKRGLAWFAENDKGWSWDRKTPNLELVRRGGVLTLVVHLVNLPVTLDQPRTLTFGLQAAPVKPRLSAGGQPGDWRYRWLRDRYSLLGTDINWLALGDCGSVYPAGKDMALWEAIRRGNTEKLTDAEIEAVYQKSLPYNQPYGEERVKAWRAHVYYNLRSRYGTKMVFYYNRASYQAADEFQTFQDEWGLSDWRTVGPGKGIGEIKVVPSESYIDHAVHWYAKSFEVGGNRGVYWDNWFFAGSYNTQMTSAYRGADGRITPSAGLWGLRELSRRTFQMMNEKGMLPITMPHMTSTNILPLHGFATVQYDWEWKYSEGDVQYRFPREYILLVSNGELAGTWPVLLGDHGNQSEDPWTQRTFAAVSLLHELDGPVMASVADKLYRPVWALLEQPGCDIWRYWDERPQPVKSANPDLPTIVYGVKGKQALAAVVGYVDGDTTCELNVDAAALGLAGGWKATDAETGAAIEPQGGRLVFPLKKHDVRLVRLEAK
ncbi:MAG: hypothetical protein HZB16_19120 [Armatimonadetes bacterium]|nr:hypothetical protein [Armatimonadota bacterium]